jgi:ATP-dependent Clp protease protease subunit
MKFWNLTGDPGSAGDGVLDIDGEIVADSWYRGDGIVVARDFRKALEGVRNVTVHINSPGGDVMAGAEIYSALREHSLNGRGRVTVIVTALAASAASVIAMAGDEILMSPTAYMMIHNPWSIVAGDAKEMRKTARTLDVISEGLINAYQQRTGKSRDELKRMLEAETWMSAGTAVEQGFADGIYGVEAGQNAVRAVACLMGMKSHGAAEIAAKYGLRGADEDPEETEEPDEEEERSENEDDPDADPEEPGADPEEEEPEDAETEEENPNDPEEEPDEEEPEDADEEEDPEDPEEEPEEEEPEDADEEEDPEEEPEEDEDAKRARIAGWAEEVCRAEIARRAEIMAKGGKS